MCRSRAVRVMLGLSCLALALKAVTFGRHGFLRMRIRCDTGPDLMPPPSKAFLKQHRQGSRNSYTHPLTAKLYFEAGFRYLAPSPSDDVSMFHSTEGRKGDAPGSSFSMWGSYSYRRFTATSVDSAEEGNRGAEVVVESSVQHPPFDIPEKTPAVDAVDSKLYLVHVPGMPELDGVAKMQNGSVFMPQADFLKAFGEEDGNVMTFTMSMRDGFVYIPHSDFWLHFLRSKGQGLPNLHNGEEGDQEITVVAIGQEGDKNATQTLRDWSHNYQIKQWHLPDTVVRHRDVYHYDKDVGPFDDGRRVPMNLYTNAAQQLGTVGFSRRKANSSYSRTAAAWGHAALTGISLATIAAALTLPIALLTVVGKGGGVRLHRTSKLLLRFVVVSTGVLAAAIALSACLLFPAALARAGDQEISPQMQVALQKGVDNIVNRYVRTHPKKKLPAYPAWETCVLERTSRRAGYY